MITIVLAYTFGGHDLNRPLADVVLEAVKNSFIARTAGCSGDGTWLSVHHPSVSPAAEWLRVHGHSDGPHEADHDAVDLGIAVWKRAVRARADHGGHNLSQQRAPSTIAEGGPSSAACCRPSCRGSLQTWLTFHRARA